MIRWLTIFLFSISFFVMSGQQVEFNFLVYDALESDSEEVIDNALSSLSSKDDFKSAAYKASLVMKSAQFEFGPWNKLSRFKEGKNLLEEQISSYPGDAELRFLRLMIQENCPAILGYSSEIDNDVRSVELGYSAMLSGLQERVLKYALISVKLNENSLK